MLKMAYFHAYWALFCIKVALVTDPACGSGAFLNQCFDYLREEMDFVLEMKYQFDPQPSFFDIDKQILQNNLFGVDINPESVEITKLSLWLKTAKNNQTLATLDGNIKCGNSIVADKEAADNAFEWQKEFSEIFANGGFDIVVGNPPYGANVDAAQKQYISQHYSTFEGLFDTYKVFFELGMNLLKVDGYLGYITPNTYFELKKSGKKLREFLFSNTLLKIVELYNVFPTAIVEPVISIYQKNKNPMVNMEIILVPRNTQLSSTFENEGVHIYKSQESLYKNDDFTFVYKIDSSAEAIVNSIRSKARNLSYYCDVYNGAKPYCKNKGIPAQTKDMIDRKIYNGYVQIDETWVKYYRGKCIYRYTDLWDGEYIKYGENLAEPRDSKIFFRKKIFVRQTGDSIIAMLDEGNVANNTLHVVFPKNSNLPVEYVLGLLNSTFVSWFYRAVHPLEVGKPMAEVKKKFIEDLPMIVGSTTQLDNTVALTNSIMHLCQDRYNIKMVFIQYCNSIYEPKAITEKISNFDTIDFKSFCNELKRQKCKLSASTQMELLPLFNQKRKEIDAINMQIKALQTQLDEIVFELYGIDAVSADRIRREMVINI